MLTRFFINRELKTRIRIKSRLEMDMDKGAKIVNEIVNKLPDTVFILKDEQLKLFGFIENGVVTKVGDEYLVDVNGYSFNCDVFINNLSEYDKKVLAIYLSKNDSIPAHVMGLDGYSFFNNGINGKKTLIETKATVTFQLDLYLKTVKNLKGQTFTRKIY